MSSTESLSPVSDGLRPLWPAGVQARADWLRRLSWQPGTSRNGLRLATSQWLGALARRPGLHAHVVRRSMGMWSSCAMDWRALTQQQADRGIGRDSGTRAGGMEPAGQTHVHWHVSERTIVQSGGMRYVAMQAPHAAGMAASPAMTYALEVADHATSTPSHAVVPTAPASTLRPMHDTTAAFAVSGAHGMSRVSGNTVDMTYAHPVHHDAPTPVHPAARAKQAKQSEESKESQEEHAVTASARQASSGNAVTMTYAGNPSGRSVPPSSLPTASTKQVASAQSSPDFFALVQQKNARRAQQARLPADRPAMFGTDRGGPVQRVAAPVWPKRSDADAMQADAPIAFLGDMLYDQAMRTLSGVSHGKAYDTAAATPSPLPFDLPRARQDEPTASVPAAPGSHAPAEHGRENAELTQQANTAAANASDVPLLRNDIEYVAQRVMRIIAREQRRDREARGIN